MNSVLIKRISFLSPVAALVIGGLWIVSQRRDMDALEDQSSLLLKKIAALQVNAPNTTTPHPTSPSAALNWKKGAVDLVDDGQRSSMDLLRNKVRLMDLLKTMHKEELATMLSDIASLELPIPARRELERMLIEALIDNDPAFAVEKCASFMYEHAGLFKKQFPERYAEWAKSDPAAAVAWYVTKIASGLFDTKSLVGSSVPRLECESKLVELMLISPPDESSRKPYSLPENWRELLVNQAPIGNDKVALPLLGAPPVLENIALARHLATRISDEALRTRLLKQLESTHP